jgi:hypothetical protein
MNPGLGMAVWKGHPFFAQMVDFYNHHHYVRWNGKNTGNITLKVTRFLDYDHKMVLDGGIVSVNDLLIYPIEYFCPLDYYTGQMNITENTRTIHHYMASWVKKTNRFQSLLFRLKSVSIRILCTLKHHI